MSIAEKLFELSQLGGNFKNGPGKPIVIIEWQDSCGCSPGWIDTKDITLVHQICYSVGYLWQLTDNEVLIVPHFASGCDGHSIEACCGDMSIPISSIQSIGIYSDQPLLKGLTNEQAS